MNYTEQGGKKTIIDGEIVVHGKMTIGEDATVEGLPQAENQATSTANSVSGVVADFNALLTKLKAAGLMAADAVEG